MSKVDTFNNVCEILGNANAVITNALAVPAYGMTIGDALIIGREIESVRAKIFRTCDHLSKIAYADMRDGVAVALERTR